MPLDNLTYLVRLGERHARRVLLKDHEKALMPFYHLLTREGDVVIPCRWENVAEKETMAAVVRATARRTGATAALFVTEAWIVKRQIEKPLSEWHRRQAEEQMRATVPSESPDRIEAVSIFATDGKNQRAAFLQILRDKPGGKIVALVKEQRSGGEMSGRMLDGIIE